MYTLHVFYLYNNHQNFDTLMGILPNKSLKLNGHLSLICKQKSMDDIVIFEESFYQRTLTVPCSDIVYNKV